MEAPTAWIQRALAERDGDNDGYFTPFDRCEGADDDDDVDNDSVPDACDDCPCDPEESDPWKDKDGDGICGIICSPSGPIQGDNCPDMYNVHQYNLNREAELARNAEVLGNDCDPVPVPGLMLAGSGNGERIGFRLIGDAYEGCTVETFRNEIGPIELYPMGSHGTADSEHPGEEVPVTPDWTEYRYCIESSELEINCSRADRFREEEIRIRQHRGLEEVQDTWRRVWFEGLGYHGVQGTFVENPVDLGIVYESGSYRSYTWRWQDDFTYWAETFPDYFTVPTAPIEGRMWARGMTTIGTTLAADNPLGTGMHPSLASPNQPSEKLANAAIHASPYEDTTRRDCWITSDFKVGPIAIPCFDGCPWIINPDPDEQPCPNCGALANLAEGNINDGQQLVVMPWSGGQWVGVLRSDGTMAPVEDRVGAGLMESLSQGWTWLSAVESEPRLGRGAAGPSAVALTADGTAMADRMYLAGHRVVGDRDLMVDLIDRMSAAEETAPPPRNHPIGVYARSAGRLFVLGGEDPETAEPMQDIWWRSVQNGDWLRVPRVLDRPVKVLAATRSYRDGKLWILEQVHFGSKRFDRLVRIDAGTGESEEVGKWPVFNTFDKHWLVLDDNGDIVVAESSAALHKHKLVRIVIHGPHPQLERAYVGAGELAMSPWVDVSGFALPIPRGTSKLPTVDRLAMLTGHQEGWGNVDKCR